MALQGTLNAMLSKTIGLLVTTLIVTLLGAILAGSLLLWGLGPAMEPKTETGAGAGAGTGSGSGSGAQETAQTGAKSGTAGAKGRWPDWAKFLAVPWYAYLGGFIGVVIIYGVAVAIANTGAAAATTAIVAAQLITAALLDHFGLFGLKQSPLTWLKGLGIALLAVSAYLVLRQDS